MDLFLEWVVRLVVAVVVGCLSGYVITVMQYGSWTPWRSD